MTELAPGDIEPGPPPATPDGRQDRPDPPNRRRWRREHIEFLGGWRDDPDA